MKVKLNQIFDLQMGKTPSRNNEDYWNGTNKWVSIADIGNSSKYIFETKECITDKGVTESGIKKVPCGTVIMSFKLSIGKTAITSEDMFTNEAIMAFIDRKIYQVDTNYFYHFCLGKDWTAGTNKAVMGLTLNKAMLSEVSLELPSIEDQVTIANKLDFVDSLITARREQLAKLDELVKSRFIELFGDPVLNPNAFTEGIVSDYCKMTQGTQIPMSEQVGEFRDGYYRYLYIRDLKYNDGNWIYVQDKYDDKKLTEKDLVVVNTGNTAGEIYYGKDGILSNNLFKVSFDTGVLNTTYMFAYFSSQQFQSMLWNEMKEGTQPHLGHKIFGSKKLIVPPMDLQKQFAAFVEQTDKSKFEIQKSLEKLETLKKALMQKYFG